MGVWCIQLAGAAGRGAGLWAAAGLFDVCSGTAMRDFLGEERREEDGVA